MNIDELAKKIRSVSDEKEVQRLVDLLIEWKNDYQTTEDLNDTIERYIGNSCIAEAEALLKLTPEERLKLRYRQEHIFKTKVIYYDTMDDSDREILYDFLAGQFAVRSPGKLRNKVIEQKRHWKNPKTGISYSVNYNQTYRMKVSKTDRYIPCIASGSLSTSLHLYL